MRKYIGKYRVLIERDLDTGEPIEFTYINGTGGRKHTKVYRYDNDTLVIYVPTRWVNNIVERVSECITVEKTVEYDGEVDIYIKEVDLHRLDHIFKFKTLGANISPESIKNHPRYKEIKKEKRDNMSEEELNILRDRFKNNIRKD